MGVPIPSCFQCWCHIDLETPKNGNLPSLILHEIGYPCEDRRFPIATYVNCFIAIEKCIRKQLTLVKHVDMEALVSSPAFDCPVDVTKFVMGSSCIIRVLISLQKQSCYASKVFGYYNYVTTFTMKIFKNAGLEKELIFE